MTNIIHTVHFLYSENVYVEMHSVYNNNKQINVCKFIHSLIDYLYTATHTHTHTDLITIQNGLAEREVCTGAVKLWRVRAPPHRKERFIF